MRKKVYFAASISGGRQDAPLYAELINFIRPFCDVQTEHIGNPNLTNNGESLDPQQIHDRDIAWLMTSDALIVEATVDSAGVGYELGRYVRPNCPGCEEKMARKGKPILILWRPIKRTGFNALIHRFAKSVGVSVIPEKTRLTPMLVGTEKMLGVVVAQYSDIDEAKQIISTFLWKYSLANELLIQAGKNPSLGEIRLDCVQTAI